MPDGQVNVNDAKTFAAQFVPDPKIIESMAEPDLLAYHGKVKGTIDTAVQEAIKARGEFGPNWRQALAGENKDDLPTLERLKDPGDIWKSYKELRGKLSSGQLKAVTPFPAEGTPEQQNAWRAENGIPTKPEEYQVKPPEGVVLGDADKPFVEDFLKYAHGKNLSNDTVNTAIGFWAEQRAKRIEAEAIKQMQLKQATEDTLRKEWGNDDFRVNMSRIEGALAMTLPKDSPMVQGIMASVQTVPEFAKWMAEIAFKLNPAGSVPAMGAEGEALPTISDWLKKADDLMRKDRKAYNNSEYSRDYAKYADAYRIHSGKEWGRG